MKTFFYFLLMAVTVWGNERTQLHMGTLISVTIAEENLSDEVFSLFADLDQRLSTYKSDSEISRLNRNHEINGSDVTCNILERSLEIHRLSEGAFDVTIGSLTHGAYRFGYEDEHLPSRSDVQKLKKFVGSERIVIEEERIRLLPGTIVDLGGIGKGYAVDLAMELLQRNGVEKAIVAASGDIGCIGECVVEIQDPFHPQGHIATVVSSLPRFAISTSGNYERYIKNKTHNHLLHPKTGYPQQRYASITLMDRGDNTRIDALATAVLVMEEKKAIAMLEKLKIGYVLIRNDGTILKSIMPHGVVITL
ncbi:MAG TPA: FAD:protein FMN transferase [Sulfuricurvum sp.]|nr:FAD:protein FMN transferase [Sulfuricurvum sp.]